jgi:hypothetical protein
MKRSTFLWVGGLTGLAAPFVRAFPSLKIPPHNWEGYDFGPPPQVSGRLFQGPFSNYGPEANVPGGNVVMTTTPSDKPVPNYGMGMVTYLCDEAGPVIHGKGGLRTAIEDLAKWPLGNVLYLRVDWRDIQKTPGKLEFPEHWDLAFEMAEKHRKRVAFRIQLMNPVIEGEAIPDFLLAEVPMVKLGTTDEIGLPGKVHFAPRYDHPSFQRAFREMDTLLAEKYNGHPLVEYVDTCMYGFWGEGHTWPFEGNPFPDYFRAEKTFIDMFEHQAANWSQTPLVTNTQPDYSNVGNSEVLDRTVRTYNWLRTDTIFIENSQIDALSNRPPWIGATIEQGLTTGDPGSLDLVEGVPKNLNIIAHVRDVAPNYFSLWNWHRISLDNLLGYYQKYPDHLNTLAAEIGYRIRPSWIWSFEKDGFPGLVLGMVNDGIAAVPGALVITVRSSSGNINLSGSLDAGYPHPGKVRQVLFMLPEGTAWDSLEISLEIEVKGVRRPISWACAQQLEANGALKLRPNLTN